MLILVLLAFVNFSESWPAWTVVSAPTHDAARTAATHAVFMIILWKEWNMVYLHGATGTSFDFGRYLLVAAAAIAAHAVEAVSGLTMLPLNVELETLGA